MQYDMTLTDHDREINYYCTVNARVVAEFGGLPGGHCCDVDGVSVNSVEITIGKLVYTIPISHHAQKFEEYIAELFDEQIREECIERFQNQPSYVED